LIQVLALHLLGCNYNDIIWLSHGRWAFRCTSIAKWPGQRSSNYICRISHAVIQSLHCDRWHAVSSSSVSTVHAWNKLSCSISSARIQRLRWSISWPNTRTSTRSSWYWFSYSTFKGTVANYLSDDSEGLHPESVSVCLSCSSWSNADDQPGFTCTNAQRQSSISTARGGIQGRSISNIYSRWCRTCATAVFCLW